MSTANTAPRRATRTMHVARVEICKTYFLMDLSIKHCPMTFHIAVPLEHRSVQAFAGPDGKFEQLQALQGQEALFYFDNFTTNGYLEVADLVRIKKVTGKA